MYKREEAAAIRKEFWTTFGRYMKPIPSSEGFLINWINYRTEVPGIQFKMDVTQKEACIAIEINIKDEGIRTLVYEQLVEFKKLLELELGESWNWSEPSSYPTRVETTLKGVSIFKTDDWAAIIQFLKPRIIALDSFWENPKLVFKDLIG